MTRPWALLPALLLSACGTSTTQDAPRILSVRPSHIASSRARDTRVQVALDATLPIRVDYAHEEAHTAPVHVWIGEEKARVEDTAVDGTLRVALPPGLDVGSHALRVVLADGREGTRSEAVTIIPLAPAHITDAGNAPANEVPLAPGDITGFALEPLADQVLGEPFLVVIHAEGPRAAHFQGTVTLSIHPRNGTVSPSTLGPFRDGVHAQPVTVTARGGNLKLTVTDALGAQGTSNGFKVK